MTLLTGRDFGSVESGLVLLGSGLICQPGHISIGMKGNPITGR